jgi:hypothetical protein
MSYNYDYSTQGSLGAKDIAFIANNNVPYNVAQLYTDMNSLDPLDCMAHRGIQENLRDNYGYKSDQKTWNENCKVIHEYTMTKNEKKKKK